MSSPDYEIILISPIKVADFANFQTALSLTDLQNAVEKIVKNVSKNPTDMIGLSPGQGKNPTSPVYIYFSSSQNTDQKQEKIAVKGHPDKLAITQKQRVFPNPIIPSIPGLPSIYEGQITLPAMNSLQQLPDYARNTIMLWLTLTVDCAPGTCNPYKLPIRLPEPQIGTHTITPSPKSASILTVQVGKTGATPNAADTQHLGIQLNANGVGGEIRWYTMDLWKKLSIENLALPSFSGISQSLANLSTVSIQLGSLVTEQTSKIRTLGSPLKATEWGDDGAAFVVPKDPDDRRAADSGFAVIWRDDIPSKPIPVLDNFAQIIAVTSSKPTSLPSFTGVSTLNLSTVIKGVEEAAKQVIAKLGAMPKGLVYIYYCSFGTGAETDQVKAELSTPTGLEIKGRSTVYASTNPLIPSVYEIQAYIPTMAQLETSPNYKRNNILMWLNIKIVNQKNSNRKSSFFGFPLWIPSPHAGKPQISTNSNGDTIIKLGNTSGGRFFKINACSNFGAPSKRTDNPSMTTVTPFDGDGGQARWYSLETWNNINLNNLQPFNLTSIDQSINIKDIKSITVPKAVADITWEIRRMGTPLPYDKWQDDGISCTIPKELGDPFGFLVIWRDDIPSNPIPILENIDWSKLLEGLTRRLVHWNINGLNIDWDGAANGEAINENNPIPIPLTQGTLDFCINRMVVEANAFLERYLAQYGFDIQIAYQLKPAKDSIFAYGDLRNPSAISVSDKSLSSKNPGLLNFTGISSIGLNSPLSLAKLSFNLPWAALYEVSANPKNRDFLLETALKISIQLPTDNPLGIKLPNQLVFNLPAIKFKRELLEIPTIALLFEHADFKGVPLVFMQQNSYIPSFNYDDKSSGSLAEIKHKVWKALDAARAAVGITQFFSGSQELEAAGKVLEWIDNATHIVINTQGSIDDLSQCIIQKGDFGNTTFSGLISSVILIGIPSSANNLTLRCSTQTNHRGEYLKLAIPDGTFIAALPNVGYLNNTYTSPFYSTPLPKPNKIITVAANNGLYDYNDRFQSIKFEALNGVSRWYNPTNYDQFLTQSQYGEYCFRNGYQYEGTYYQLFPDGFGNEIGKPEVTAPFYRYVNKTTGIHCYSKESNLPNFKEGTLGWIAINQLPGTVELYKWYSSQRGSYFYTTNYGEGTLVAQALGYQYQGVVGWVIPV